MSSMSFSVLISTYNGEKYIVEQLESIRRQSVPVDEVIIRDDCSTDHTVEVISRYIEEHALTEWRLLPNTENLGWRANFHRGMADCTKEFILLCDQDDIWLPDKVMDIKKCMDNSKINVLATDYELKYEKENGSSRYDVYKKEMTNSGELVRLPFTSRWPYTNRPGCTYCVRRSFFEMINPYWDEALAHDGMIWRCAIGTDSLWLLRKNEIIFRRHEENATGSRDFSVTARLGDISRFIKSFQALQEVLKKEGNHKRYEQVDDGLHWLSIRKTMFEERKFHLWFKLAFHYEKYYSSYKGLLGDAVYYFKAKH